MLCVRGVFFVSWSVLFRRWIPTTHCTTTQTYPGHTSRRQQTNGTTCGMGAWCGRKVLLSLHRTHFRFWWHSPSIWCTTTIVPFCTPRHWKRVLSLSISLSLSFIRRTTSLLLLCSTIQWYPHAAGWLLHGGRWWWWWWWVQHIPLAHHLGCHRVPYLQRPSCVCESFRLSRCESEMCVLQFLQPFLASYPHSLVEACFHAVA